jgi:hypothetical protein
MRKLTLAAITIILWFGVMFPLWSQILSADTGSTSLAVPPAVTISASLPLNKITFNEKLIYTITIAWNAAAGELDFSWPDPPRSDKFAVVGNASSSQRTVSGDTVLAIKKFVYELKPLATGATTIEPSVVRYRVRGAQNAQEEKTRFLDVTIVPAQTERHWAHWLWLVALAAAVAVVYGCKKMLSSRPLAGQQDKPADEPMVPLEDRIRIQVRDMDKLLMNGDTKDYCAGISRALKTYLEERYKVALGNLLTASMLEVLHHAQVPEETVSLAQRIWELADTIKFATSRPEAGEVERMKIMFNTLLDRTAAGANGST